jgi:hypothetical protein
MPVLAQAQKDHPGVRFIWINQVKTPQCCAICSPCLSRPGAPDPSRQPVSTGSSAPCHPPISMTRTDACGPRVRGALPRKPERAVAHHCASNTGPMTHDGQRFIVPRLQPLSRQWMALILPIFAAAAATVVAVAYTRDVIAASGAAASGAASSDLPSAQPPTRPADRGPHAELRRLKAWAATATSSPSPSTACLTASTG